MAAAMEVVLSPRGAVIFHQVVKCHQKVGKEVALEATGEELKMATMNDAQTVTMVSSFHRSFFWSFVLDPNDPFRATVLTRLLVNALTKTPRGDRLVMSDNTSHAFLSILGDSKHGICTTQCLAYRESDLAAPLPHIGQRPRRHVIRLSAKDLDTVIRHMDKKAGGGGGRGANLTHEMRLCLDRGNQHINFRSYDDVTEDPIPKDDAAQQPHQQQQQQQQAVKRTTRSITITGTSFACFDIGHSSQGDGGGASGAASGSRGSTQGSVPLPKESWFVFPVKEIKALTALAAQVHSEVSLIFNRPGRPVVATIGVKAQMASHDDEYLFQNLTDALIQQLGTYDMGHFETDAGNEGGPVTANLHAWGSILWLSTIDTDMEPYDDDMYFDPTENDQQQPQDAPQPPPAAAAGAGAPPPPAPNDMDDEGLDDLLDGLNDEWLQQQRQQQQQQEQQQQQGGEEGEGNNTAEKEDGMAEGGGEGEGGMEVEVEWEGPNPFAGQHQHHQQEEEQASQRINRRPLNPSPRYANKPRTNNNNNQQQQPAAAAAAAAGGGLRLGQAMRRTRNQHQQQQGAANDNGGVGGGGAAGRGGANDGDDEGEDANFGRHMFGGYVTDPRERILAKSKAKPRQKPRRRWDDVESDEEDFYDDQAEDEEYPATPPRAGNERRVPLEEWMDIEKAFDWGKPKKKKKKQDA